MDPEERARERARRPNPRRVEFAAFELPDNPENDRILSPVTRRWVPKVVDSSDSSDEDENKDKEKPADKNSEGKSKASKMAPNLNGEKPSSPIAGKRSSGPNSKITTSSTGNDVPSDAMNVRTASRVNHSSGVSPKTHASTLAQPARMNPTQPKYAPAAPSASPSPASFRLSGNTKIDAKVSPKTPTPSRVMGPQSSPLSWGSRKASGLGGRVTESIRNGKRRVEIDLISDDEDMDASPSQNARTSASRRAETLRRMASSSTGVYPGSQVKSNPTESSTYKSAKRLTQPVALERRLFTTAPKAILLGAQDAIQGRQAQSQTPPVQDQVTSPKALAIQVPGAQAHVGPFQSDTTAAQARKGPTMAASTHDNGQKMVRQASPGLFVEQPQGDRTPIVEPRERSFVSMHPGPLQFDQRTAIDLGAHHGLPFQYMARPAPAPYPYGPLRQTMMLGSSRSGPHINNLLQAQVQGTLDRNAFSINTNSFGDIRPRPRSGPAAPYQSIFGASPPQTTGNMGGAFSKADTNNVTGSANYHSNTGPEAHTPLRTPREVEKEDASRSKRSATSCQDGMREPQRNPGDSESDDDDVSAYYLRPKRQKRDNQAGNVSRSSVHPNDGASQPQETKTQIRGQAAAALSSPGSRIAPQTTGVKDQTQQFVRSNVDVVAAFQGQTRPATIFPRMGLDRSNSRQMTFDSVVYPSAYDERQRPVPGLRRDDPTKADNGRVAEQRREGHANNPLVVLEDDEDDEDVENDKPYEYAEDYSDGDDEYSPDKRQDKSRSWDKGCKTPKTKNVNNKSSRVVALGIPIKALHLFQPPKDPSVPMGTDLFSKLPMEVRRRIYRELLKAKDSITVLNGWSQVYRRQQLDLHASILAASKKHHTDANAVLYGENVFRYVLRDDANMVEFEVGKKNKDERTLPLKKKIDHLRYLELEVEPNRIDMAASMAFYTALDILVENKATKLFRLTIDLSPRLQKGVQGKKGMSKDRVSQREWFTRAQGITGLLKDLKAHFVFFDIHLEEHNESKATSLRTVVDMRPEISDNEVSAEMSKHSDHLKLTMTIENRRELARERVDERLEAEAYKKLDMMNTRLEQAVLKGAPYMLRRGWFEEFKSKRRQRKTIRAGDEAGEDE